ncbi:MAG: hypothetical protein ACK559_11695, partial [bacterium]
LGDASQVGGEKLRREQAGRGVGQPRSAYAVQRPTRHLLATMRAGEASVAARFVGGCVSRRAALRIFSC